MMPCMHNVQWCGMKGEYRRCGMGKYVRRIRMRSIGPQSSDAPEHPNSSVYPELEPPTAPDYAARSRPMDGAARLQELRVLRCCPTDHGERPTVLRTPKWCGV